MAKVDLYPDFKGFLKSLNSAKVKYLVLGGYAVIYYGYHRVTDDLDVWVAIAPDNAERVSKALQEYFGFSRSAADPKFFLETGKVFMFGIKPVRIDILTGPSGVEFNGCFSRRNMVVWDGIKVPLIAFEDLKQNKLASGRPKDVADIQNLPPIASPGIRKTKGRVARPSISKTASRRRKETDRNNARDPKRRHS